MAGHLNYNVYQTVSFVKPNGENLVGQAIMTKDECGCGFETFKLYKFPDGTEETSGHAIEQNFESAQRHLFSLVGELAIMYANIGLEFQISSKVVQRERFPNLAEDFQT